MAGTSETVGDYRDFEKQLVLVIDKKKYPIPPVAYDDGLFLDRVFVQKDKDAAKEWAEKPRDEQNRVWLGAVLDEMIEDKVGYSAILRAANAAFAAFAFGADAGVAMWETGDVPEAVAAAATNRETRRRLVKTARGSTSTGGASTTTKRGSGRSTTSRRKS